ncbi:MAG TPA: peptide ABC transporter substrate-binding protein [Ktedonobacterales bacterium]|nr:peptide ABC transporter substrate-binding protein [Ktedonobacterales bacterium]
MRLGARKTSLAALLTLAGSLAMLLAGCQSGGGSSGKAALPDSQQIFKDQISGIADIKTVDPAVNTDLYSAEVISVVYPGLLVLDPKLAVEPWAAQGMPAVSSDGLTYTFKVKPGLKWSDGTPIDANSFAYSINRAESPCTASPAAYYLYTLKDALNFNTAETCDAATGKIKGSIQTLIGDSVIVPDAQTLELKLAQPATYFLEAMTYPISYAVPQQLISKYPTDWTQHMIDNGGLGGNLYKITTWNHAGKLVLQRNDSFWGTKPKLREVDITFYKDTTTAYNSYLSGKDDIGAAPTAQLAQAKTHAGFHQVGVQQIDYYAMNWKIKPFDDVRVRQAFAIALDKTALANNVLHGAVQATNHIVPDGMPGYNPNLKGPDGTQSLSGNAQAANQLAAAYATDTKCGTATDFSKCPAVTLTIPSGNVDGSNEAAAAQQMWAKAFPGWKINITSIDFGTLLTNLNAKTVQFWAIAWIEDYPDPQDWLTTNLACDSAYNSGSACDKTADTLMHTADANPNLQERLTQYQQAEQALVTQVGWLPLDQATTWWEVRPWVVNFNVAAGGLTPLDTWQTIYITQH